MNIIQQSPEERMLWWRKENLTCLLTGGTVHHHTDANGKVTCWLETRGMRYIHERPE